MGKEKTFENKVKAFLEKHNIWYVKYFANGFTKRGVPDLLACVNGRFVGIEIKSETGISSPLQQWNIEEITKSGGIGFILYPKDFEDFKKMILTILELRKW